MFLGFGEGMRVIEEGVCLSKSGEKLGKTGNFCAG